MKYIELHSDLFDNDSILRFWNKLIDGSFDKVNLNIDTEIGSVIATEIDWIEKGNLPAMGVSLHASIIAGRWQELAESDITDQEYETVVDNEAAKYLQQVLSYCPQKITVIASTVDGQYY